MISSHAGGQRGRFMGRSKGGSGIGARKRGTGWEGGLLSRVLGAGKGGSVNLCEGAIRERISEGGLRVAL